MARKLLTDSEFPVRETDLTLTIAPDPDAVYHIRALDLDTIRTLTDRHSVPVPRGRGIPPELTEQRERESIIAVNNAMLDYVVVRWDGVRNGADPAPCDLAHKLKLPAQIQRALLQQAEVGSSDEVRAASFRESA